MYGGHPSLCPLHEISDKSIEEKTAWIGALSDERVLEILDLHKHCKTRFQECLIDGL
jgi:hypothetical protein